MPLRKNLVDNNYSNEIKKQLEDMNKVDHEIDKLLYEKTGE